MRELPQLPRRLIDVLLADALHDPLDAPLHGRLLPQQRRVRGERGALPLAVETVAAVVRVKAEDRPEGNERN